LAGVAGGLAVRNEIVKIVILLALGAAFYFIVDAPLWAATGFAIIIVELWEVQDEQ
jgi:uncharacterized membrane protein